MSSEEADVTKRGFDHATARADPGATRRGPQLETGSHAPAAQLAAGDTVGSRYRVLEGPIGNRSGEAEVYRCEETDTGRAVAVKIYYRTIRPKEDVLKQLAQLVHEDVVQLLDWGDWNGRFFEVAEFCTGGTAADFMPIDEAIAQRYLMEAVSGLQYLHTQEQPIIHRDIKPSNLYFRDEDRSDLVIGDFGISSVIPGQEDQHITTTAKRFTEIYVAPELRAGGRVSSKADYYSLGLTLIVLLRGGSPFVRDDGEEFTSGEVQDAKRRGRLGVPESISAPFARLLRGLTRFHPKNRWGHDQVQQWSRGDPVMRDDGLADREEVYAGHSDPYPRDHSIDTPEIMAQRLDSFDAQSDLFRGFISRWLFSFSSAQADRVIEIEDNFTKDQELGVFKLQYVLDPSRPLVIAGEQSIQSLRGLHGAIFSALQHPGSSGSKALRELLASRKLECWADASLDPEHKRTFVEGCIKIRKHSKDPWTGLLRLALLIDPRTPFPLGPRVILRSPEEIEASISGTETNRKILEEALFTGRFAEWLRGAFADQSACQFVDACTKRLKNNKPLGTMSVRWYFAPAMGLSLGGREFGSARELFEALLLQPELTEEGVELLKSGYLREWLVSSGRLRSTEAFDECAGKEEFSWRARLQALAESFAPGIARPKLQADRTSVDLGLVSMEGSRQATVTIGNAGQGYLYGEYHLEGNAAGFTVLRGASSFEGGPAGVTIQASPAGVPAGSSQQATLVIQTNGGRMEIPIRYNVGVPWARMVIRSLLFGLIAGGWLVGLRALAGLSQDGAYFEKPLTWRSFDAFFPNGFALLKPMPIFDAVPTLLAAIFLIASIYGVIRWIVGRAKC